MRGGLLRVKFVNSKNCFLHFSHANFAVYAGSLVCGVKVETNTGRALYFTPATAPSGELNEETAGLSAAYARCLKLNEGDTLRVKTLNNLGSVNRVMVNPATRDDYDLIHSTSSAIESSLLGQLRIVWPGQMFCCWITKNISVSMVVGEIQPNLNYGRLEEYTEVVVGDSIGSDSREGTVGKSNDTERIDPVAQEIRCRAILLDDNLIESCKLDRCVPPFVVYLNSKDKPSWYVGSEMPLWKLTLFSPQSDESVTSVVVQLVFAEEPGFDDRPWSGWVSLAVTESVRHFLKVKAINGAKMLLKPQPRTSLYVNRKRSSGLLITPSFNFKNQDLLVKEIREELFNMALFSGGLLLNTKSRLFLSSSPSQSFFLTLRPLDLEWTCLLLTDLQEFSISLNEYTLADDAKDILETKVSISCDNIITEEDRRQLLGTMYRCVQTGSVCNNILICGKSGSGKTTLASHLLSELSNVPHFCFTHQINCFTLKGKRIEVQAKIFLEILNDCIKNQPSVLLLDNIDALGKRVDKEKEETEAALYYNRVSYKLLALFEEFQNKHAISLIGTASSPSAVNARIYCRRGRSLFTSCFDIPDLTQVGRTNILKELLLKYTPHLNLTDDLVDNVGKMTEGFLPVDLVNLAKRAYFEACKRKVEKINLITTIIDSDLNVAVDETKPSYLSGMNLLKEKTYSWPNVGGLHEAKSKLTEMILWPSKYPHIMNQCPLKPQMGVLLYGAPGSGKTILARAAARESNLNFIVVKGPELMSKYIGQSEEAVRNIFNKASSAKPSILFFDEFESLAPRRGQDQTGVTDRVVNQFLTALDGVEPLTGVFVMAATSRPDLIDPALLRPGRIGTLIHCPFPNEDERFEILQALSLEIPLDDDVDLRQLAKLSDGFSGADLKGVLTSAQMMLIDILVAKVDIDLDDISSACQPNMTIALKQEQLLEALRTSKPTLSDTERQKYESIYAQFLNPSLSRLTTQKVTLA